MIFSKVDLPEPFGPTNPTWSPSANPTDKSVNNGFTP
jgi:hypothetical protein